MKNIQGKVALVTGAAQGAGFATARALAAEGVKVALVDLDATAVKSAAAEIGGSAIGLAVDVTDHHAYLEALDETERVLGPLDILVNNAGIMPIGPFDQETDATAARVVEINFHAMLFGSKQALRRFKAHGINGHIINVASGAGWIPGAGGVSYGGSKAAVVAFSEALNWELHGTGIEVSVVAPAVIKTRLGDGLADVKGLRKVTPDDVAGGIVKCLKKPRFVVWVPFEMGILSVFMCGLPYRARAAIARLTNADKLLLTADSTARSNYEQSIAGVGGDVK